MTQEELDKETEYIRRYFVDEAHGNYCGGWADTEHQFDAWLAEIKAVAYSKGVADEQAFNEKWNDQKDRYHQEEILSLYKEIALIKGEQK